MWRLVQLGSLAIAAVGGWAWVQHGGRPAWAAAMAALWLLLPAWTLALQTLWAAHRLRVGGLRGPSACQRARAWAAEVRWNLQVFGWQQPWRAQALPDTDRAVPSRGVLLVHGHLCNRAFWLPWLRWLRARGVPYATVNLWPIWADIDQHAPAIEAAVQRLIVLTGQAPLVLAHSKGGLAVRAWWRWRLSAGDSEAAVLACIHAVITVATPHQGTELARSAVGVAGQLAPGSDWLRALAASESAAWRARLLCVASDTDAVVYPAPLAALPGAGECLLPGRAHIELAFDAAVRERVWAALARPAGALPW